MKTSNRLALIGVLSLALSALSASAQTDRRAPDGPRPGFRRPGPPKELLEKYDLNKDGRLDEQEHEAIRKDIEDGKLQPPPRPPRGPGAMGGPRPGMMPAAKDIIDKFDADKDGKLDETELTAFLQDMRQHRPGPGRPGPMGPPPGDVPPPDAPAQQ